MKNKRATVHPQKGSLEPLHMILRHSLLSH